MLEDILYPSPLYPEFILNYSEPLLNKVLEDIYYGWKVGVIDSFNINRLRFLDTVAYSYWMTGYEGLDRECTDNKSRCLKLNISGLLYPENELRGVDFDIINGEEDNEIPDLIVYP
jgi:hypothetical protein